MEDGVGVLLGRIDIVTCCCGDLDIELTSLQLPTLARYKGLTDADAVDRPATMLKVLLDDRLMYYTSHFGSVNVQASVIEGRQLSA